MRKHVETGILDNLEIHDQISGNRMAVNLPSIFGVPVFPTESGNGAIYLIWNRTLIFSKIDFTRLYLSIYFSLTE